MPSGTVQPQIPQGYIPQPTSQIINAPTAVFVRNASEIDNYIVLPGNTVVFITYDFQAIWVKTADNGGNVQPIRVFARVDPTPQPQQPEPATQIQNGNSGGDYVTKAEFASLTEMIQSMKASIDEWNK